MIIIDFGTITKQRKKNLNGLLSSFSGALWVCVMEGSSGRWGGEGHRRGVRQSRVGWLGPYRAALPSGCGDWPPKTPEIEPPPPTATSGFGLGFSGLW